MGKRKYKRVVAISDLHCGHRVGLTPPQWQLNPENEWDKKYATIQAEQWNWYVRTITGLGPIDLLLVLGDCVDGKSERADGRDVIRPKEEDQIEMAVKCLEEAKAVSIEMVYGTRSHVRNAEYQIAEKMKARIGSHGWPEVNGVIFDIKHKIGGSSIPHGRATALLRAKLWNTLWAVADRAPRADFLLRGHVHYCIDVGVLEGAKEVRCITMPALEGLGSEYGAEQCEGEVHFGMLSFDVYPDGHADWRKHICVLESQKAQTSKY